jgi:hypothetical protein
VLPDMRLEALAVCRIESKRLDRIQGHAPR